MSRSVLRPEHQQQLKDLRAWARLQGKTPPATLNAEREKDLAQAMGQAPTTTDRNPSETTASPAPDNAIQENLDGHVHSESD